MPSRPPFKILFLSTPVGPLGSGLGGGVELTLRNLAQDLQRRGHHIDILAPAGSELDGLTIQSIPGNLQFIAQSQSPDTGIWMPESSVLANMWDYAYHTQGQYDLLVNFAYDWLPFYLTTFFHRPIAHLVSMGSLTAVMDQILSQTIERFPGSIGMHSRAQAATFEFGAKCRCLGNGLDLSLYEFCAEPDDCLAWVGRIAPEKGLEDAIAAIAIADVPLKIWGAMPDPDYWQDICQIYPDAPFSYEGFLPTHQLQQALGRCRGLLMTPHWVEAFGNVAIEAMACGVPVIAYHRGGPGEIVQPGKTGWLVEPDSVEGLVEAIARLPRINRRACRQRVEQEYSMTAMGDRVETWFKELLGQDEA